MQRALHCAGDPRAAFDVVDEDQASTGTQDAGHLGDGLLVVRDCAEAERAYDGVEGGVAEWQLVGVGLLQGGGSAELA